MSALASLVLGLISGGVMAPDEAEAATPIALDLDWQSPAGCPKPDHLRTTISRLVGRPVDVRAGSSTRVRAQVRPGGSGFVVDVWARTGDAEDRRTIDAARCAVLADATALIVAVALRPMAVAAAVPLEDEPRPEAPPQIQRPTTMSSDPPTMVAPEPERPEPEPSPSPSEPAAPSISAPLAGPTTRSGDDPSPATRSSRPRFGVGATIGPGFGVLPGVAAELRGSVALIGQRWRLEGAFMHWFPRVATAGRVTPGAEVETTLTGGGLRACGTLGRTSLRFPLCAGAELGSMRGRGRLVELSRTARSAWMGAVVGPGLTWSPSPMVALRLSTDLIVALIRPGFDVRIGDEPRVLYRAPAFGGRASLGIEIRLP